MDTNQPTAPAPFRGFLIAGLLIVLGVAALVLAITFDWPGVVIGVGVLLVVLGIGAIIVTLTNNRKRRQHS